MLDIFFGRLLLWTRYRSRSLATNVRQFEAAAAVIEKLVAAAPEPVLRGRRPVPALPGVTPIMRGWSAFMTIAHCNDVHESLLGLLPQLDAGREIDIGDIGRFDHPAECGPEVMPRFRDLAGRVVAAYEAIKAEGLSFPADTAAVMRLLAPRFTKSEMRRVYAALVAATA